MKNRSTIFALAACAALLGCSTSKKEQLVAPQITIAPYGDSGSELVFAALPLRNESGTTTVDCGLLTDKLIAAVEEVRGIRTIPQNSVLKSMSARGISQIRGPEEASQLAATLGVDAVIIGTVNSYDPYTPSIGLTLALFGAPGAPVTGGAASNPINLVSSNLDGKNQQVQLDVRNYAVGRVPADSALSWRRYLASMDLYCEFACYDIMRELMRKEWIRLGKSQSAVPTDPTPTTQAP